MDDFYAARSGTIPPLPGPNFAPPLIPLIAIDGGITEATIPVAASFGPQVIVSGSAVFKAGASIAGNLDGLRRAAL